MELDVDVVNYIPKNTDNNFLHVYMHEPQDQSLLETRGKLFSVIDFTSKDKIDLKDIINEFLDDLENEYFSEEVSSIVNVLDKSITNAYEKLSKKIIELNLHSNIDFNVGCFVLWGDIAYMARIGNSNICLFRESKLMNLSEHLLAVGNSIVSTASGYAKDGDVFVLSTSNISSYLSDNDIEDICLKNQDEINHMDLDSKNVSFLTLTIKAIGREIHDDILEDTIIEDNNKDDHNDNTSDIGDIDDVDITIDKEDSNIQDDDIAEKENIDSVKKEDDHLIRNSLNDFDLKGNTKKAYSYIISTTKDLSLSMYKNVNENMKKVDWAGILKSIITVVVSFFQLIFNSIMYLKDKTQKQYKLKINRDVLTLKKEKNTVFSIIIFIVLVIVIYHFFF